MKEYYWTALLIETGERVNGCIFARGKEEAIQQLASYGYYTMIELEGEVK